MVTPTSTKTSSEPLSGTSFALLVSQQNASTAINQLKLQFIGLYHNVSRKLYSRVELRTI
eukprot:569120-Amphidinium_carterae.1